MEIERRKVKARLKKYCQFRVFGEHEESLRLSLRIDTRESPNTLYIYNNVIPGNFEEWRAGDLVEFTGTVHRWVWKGRKYSAYTEIYDIRNLSLEHGRTNSEFTTRGSMTVNVLKTPKRKIWKNSYRS